jgi:hypothetical protein
MPVLEFDDLEVGRFVAVHSLRSLEPGPTETPRDLARAQSRRPKSPVPLGAPVEVVALNPPFVLASVVLPGGASCGPVLIDFRDVRLMPVPAAMVRALRDRFEPPKSQHEAMQAFRKTRRGDAETAVEPNSQGGCGDPEAGE